ncbi:hypothetical protein CcrKarma_gp085 [Caulobacter virus Karma]|uniref:DUF1640 domain-containing protein n=6 Tax=Viruses TaxID=10239 RepID=J3SMN9_9CAUD|nr:hypothetical protein D865_gp334 [Caulobacter phage phiCbK]YP_006989465.1 hypothetical protein CcrKarma_gp085 [Caulobacter virus Karma]YP_006989813.1 hypothetical protein D870_gp341 [Caulobacter phage CcrSwift]ARB13611.1 hypothetical protein Ccr10_gp083 [Caulobacter phage Ccr10]ARB13957.1 hypothetical protein Ccr2_gp082 [Caulobacter phage Ccr2]ARB14647.1 hypothetical protein Ccr29_gp090 [Caulobacter phage Ccr29]ARB15002.1 hypothetical protein Ccr32_gp083 [Caulobacter phage Ccr32]ARB15333.1
MSQDHNGSSSGQERIYQKLDELGSMHARTREDIARIQEMMRAVGSSQERIEKRQDHFEREIWREMEDRAARTSAQLDEIKSHTNLRIEEIEAKVDTIREERIAEKAQWRGPEKAIAALVAVAGAIAAFATILTFLKGH